MLYKITKKVCAISAIAIPGNIFINIIGSTAIDVDIITF
jgi:hypothetical protein